jgi:hypothetical protein
LFIESPRRRAAGSTAGFVRPHQSENSLRLIARKGDVLADTM